MLGPCWSSARCSNEKYEIGLSRAMSIATLDSDMEVARWNPATHPVTGIGIRLIRSFGKPGGELTICYKIYQDLPRSTTLNMFDLLSIWDNADNVQ